MRNLFLFLFLIPVSLFAQLDRIRLDMSETEFRKAVPEATRNLEAESGWIEDTGSVNCMTGAIAWRIYNDSIQAFYFTSETVQGPSEQFPKVDSAAIHELKMKADRLRSTLELVHGKPRVVYNECMTCATTMDNPFVYFAEWVFPGNGSITIVVSIVQPLGAGINKEYKPDRNSETYEMFFHIKSNSIYTKTKYDVGKSATEFLQLHPEYEPQAKFTHNHFYSIKDTATNNYSNWQIIFIDDELTYIEYNSWMGSNYGENDIEAFHAGKNRADELLDTAKKLHGRPSLSKNSTPKEYVVHTDYLTYNNDYMESEWKEKEGIASMSFVEYGGGKHVGTTFHIQYTFERGRKQ